MKISPEGIWGMSNRPTLNLLANENSSPSHRPCAARASLRRLRTTRPTADHEFQSAKWYFERKQYDRAIAHINRALMLDMDRADYWALRGRCYLLLSHFPFALSDLTRAIFLEPGNGAHYLHRGYVHQLSGRLGCAIEDWKAAVGLGNREAELLLREYGFTF